MEQLFLDLHGIQISLVIREYEKYSEWGEHWCKVSFSLRSGSWMNYQIKEHELLLSCEVDHLIRTCDLLLHNKLDDVTRLHCIEPDFAFVFFPKKDLCKQSNFVRTSHRQRRYAIKDISMQWFISFWNNGLTENKVLLTLYREDIVCFLTYLRSVAK